MKAHDFEAQTFSGKSVSLDSFAKPLWLVFFRYASCPFCNLTVARLMERYREFQQAGVEVAAVFQSPPESVAKYVGKQNPPFEIICDPEMKLYELYGLRKSWKGMVKKELGLRSIQAFSKGFMPGKLEGTVNRLPSDFLINQSNEIVYRYDGEDIGDHTDVGFMLSKGKKLKSPDKR